MLVNLDPDDIPGILFLLPDDSVRARPVHCTAAFLAPAKGAWQLHVELGSGRGENQGWRGGWGGGGMERSL